MIFNRGPKIFNEERTVFSTNGVGNWVFTCKRIKLDPYLTVYTKLIHNESKT